MRWMKAPSPLFRPRAGVPAAHHPAEGRMTKLSTLSREDQFAELLSQNLSMLEVRARMGLSNSQAQGLMTRIRAKLGAQAV
jgi:DNA-binding CsgD family transcriptional regulator